ncbi:hypothetical protein [Duganella sp. BJB1802]|uniref:hypothetical protein n=1 Tax=Duganella sp. BJB1802 TaxID=2744575 RepID=UPI001E556B45|nr:hypothetical protein [Duganella sp. BJB1802]
MYSRAGGACVAPGRPDGERGESGLHQRLWPRENIRNKNDAIDAGLIARYCAQQCGLRPESAAAGTAPVARWTQRVQALKDIRQQEENRLEALAIGGMDEVVQHVRQHITWLSAEIEKLESDIDDHIDRHPGLKHDAELLTTIPGAG